MKILIISGFLGAGKTTFIKSLVKKTGRQFVVVENEFGDVGIDGPLLSREQEPAVQGSGAVSDVWELTEGCICCSMKLDFSSSVLTIANTLNPDYLIVEPSGVAFLGPILESLKKICYGDAIQLLKPVTLIDALHYRTSVVDFRACVTDQASHAGWVLLSKSEDCTPQEFQIFSDEIQQYNPSATVPSVHYSQLPVSWWKGLLETPLIPSTTIGRTTVPEAERPKLQQISFPRITVDSIPHLVAILNRMTSQSTGRIVRAKGFFPLGNEWLRFDVVEDRYEIQATEPMDSAKLIIIGHHLDKQELEELWGASSSGFHDHETDDFV